MRKLSCIFLLISFIFLFNSCDEDFNPFGEENKIHILNCILKGNDDFQSAYLGESYFVDNFDPSSDTNKHTLDNSYIRIWFEDSVKVFNDTVVENPSNNFSITNYYHNNFSLLEDTEYQIEAAFKDGKKMYGKTKTPAKVSFQSTSDKLLPPEGRNYVKVSWNASSEQLYTASRFAFIYFKDDGVTRTRHFKAVPEDILEDDGETIKFFPEPSYANSITVQMSAFDKAMEEISEGDPDKENYIILGFIVEILIYDRNLTSYYASKAELSEGFSVSVNETDYSNIEGGRGIFGSFIRQNFSLKFTHEYVQSFGYTPGLTE